MTETSGDRGPAIEFAVARAAAENVSLTRFLYADHGGIIRGKAAHAADLEARMSSGIGHTVAMMAMSMLDHLQPVDGMGPVGEVRIVPDPATFVPLRADVVEMVRAGGRIFPRMGVTPSVSRTRCVTYVGAPSGI